MAETAAAKTADKDGNDLDAVAGNAEDDIGDTIANIREREVLYGEKSLLAVYGPLISHISATPKSFKVGRDSSRRADISHASFARRPS